VSDLVRIPTLTTGRLLLRPYRLADFDAYAAMWADPAVTRFIGGVPFTREQSWSRFLRQIGVWHHLAFGFFAIEEKATGRFAGEWKSASAENNGTIRTFFIPPDGVHYFERVAR